MMASCKIPQKVTVIVYSAKGLKPKNKGKHKFSVIFGVGGHKFRTDVIENLFDNPVFNTESEIDISDPGLPLRLTVTEKQEKDVLGQVTIALGDLSYSRTNHPLAVPLRPHKKCPNPEGELLMEAWISSATVGPALAAGVAGTDGESTSGVTAGLKKLRGRVSRSPMLGRKSEEPKERKRSQSDFGLYPAGSASCSDLIGTLPISVGTHTDNKHLNVIPGEPLGGLDSIPETSTAVSVSRRPEVNGVSPKEGPVEGGTKVVVRGTNLGLNKEDVIGLFICGANVLGSLEYASPTKLSCVTKAWKPCVGNVTVETQSGGKGSSLVQFAFVGQDRAADPVSEVSPSPRGGSAELGLSGGGNDKRRSSVDGGSSSLGRNLRAKSMFDISLTTKSQRPDITGISPLEAPADAGTKLTIRGTNLGHSSADICRLLVCGIDCLSSLEYESSSKIFCYVGPAVPGTGNVVIETVSGGKSSSSVKFSLVETKDDDSSDWNAVPYIQKESEDGPGAKTETSNRGSPSTGFGRNDGRRPIGPSTGKVIGEILPMRVEKRRNSSPFLGLKGKKSERETGQDRTDTIYEVLSPENIDNESINRRIQELEHELKLSDDRVRKLQIENKLLKEENERLRRYMDDLVNRAIVRCPEILSLDLKI